MEIKRKNRFTPKKFLPGDECTVTSDGDLFSIAEAREFINETCIFIKQTNSGLIQVALKRDKKKTYSVPIKNIRTLTGDVIYIGNITQHLKPDRC